MREEISAGGVVYFGNAILLLKKYNGDWVLPKGKIEKNEDTKDTSIREVFEEGGVKADVVKYIGKIQYSFKDSWKNNEIINKTVHWYLMKARSMSCNPQKEEGFIDARFIHIDRVKDMAKYSDEKNIIKRAIDEIKKQRPHKE
ncbi:NUDIX hydrolase [Paramaledivibacter caminithermalis]|uniref:NUDIX domain-containing protein n=1 Tax=Paramaledivibacter caminithermalis (strain DSM 15212 / CIP 107654 / DViRD3) TaxID=1121301 RepID=A0A1M6KX24_PARC5|nr:NUDIX hydrolase [Paramaledivibacter caminithermalis]SHJ63523.1 NUDIX domain-containing protein [Paramaledivibacter caminithermalis DSM 15212]